MQQQIANASVLPRPAVLVKSNPSFNSESTRRMLKERENTSSGNVDLKPPANSAVFNKTDTLLQDFEGFTGRYVWHCHILEHEDNEMMRPFEVIAAQ